VSHGESTLASNGVPTEQADRIAHAVTSPGAGDAASGLAAHAGSSAEAIFDALKLDIAHSTQTVVWIMAGVMAASFVVATLWLPKGRVEERIEDDAAPAQAEPELVHA
jgi:hypothetical protein